MRLKGLLITTVISVIISAVVAVSISVTMSGEGHGKMAFVKFNEVYEGFELTKQLSKKLDDSENYTKNILDSIEFTLKAMQVRIMNSKNSDRLLVDEFEVNKENYYLKKDQLTEANIQMANQFNEQIRNQLNQYISDYSKKEGYTYVFGVDGQGSIMYGDESENITKEVIEYINTKFQGK
jgi:outer membrane protein